MLRPAQDSGLARGRSSKNLKCHFCAQTSMVAETITHDLVHILVVCSPIVGSLGPGARPFHF